MKKIFLKIGNGMLMGIGFIVIVAIAFYSVKARTGTTSSPGDKLTSAKRNELVNNVTTLQTQVTALSGAQSNVQSSIPKARSVNSTSYADISANSNTITDIPGFSQTITLDKASKVLISGMGNYFCQGSSCHIRFATNVDGNYSEAVVQMGNNTNMRWNTWGINQYMDLSAGTHTIKIQTRGTSGYGESHVCGYSGYPNMNCTMHIMAFPN